MRRLLLSLLTLVLLTTWPALAQSGATYSTLDGSFAFTYPDGWSLRDDGAGTILLANHEEVLDKTATEFVEGDVRIQVLSPVMTQRLLALELDTPLATIMTTFLGRLQGDIEKGEPQSLTVGNHAVVRVELRDANFDITALAIEAGDGGTSLVLGFRKRGERATAEAALQQITENMTYTYPTIDRATLQVLTANNARDLTPLAIWGGHSTWIRTIAFSPDSTRIATGDGNGIVRVWDITTGRATVISALDRAFSAGPVFSPDGTSLLFGGFEGEVWRWDISTQQVAQDYSALSGVVWGVAFNSGGTQLAAAGEDLTARVYDAASGEELTILTGHRDGLTGVAFNPNRAILGTTSWDNTVRLWNLDTGLEIRALEGPTGGFTSLVFSPDGERVAAGARNGTIRIWNLQTGDEILVFQAEGDTLEPITAVAFSPDGSLIAAGGQDSTVRVWDTNFGIPQVVLDGPSWMNGIAFSPDGTMIAAANDAGVVMVWGVRGE